MTAKIKTAHFCGGGQIYAKNEGGLTHAVRSVLIQLARLAASSVTDLTDSSGAVAANGTVEAITDFTPAVVGSTDAVQKAELEASFAAMTDGLKELIAQANAIHAVVPALDGVLVDSLVGTAVDGTIAAIDQSMTAVATSLASAAGANAFVDAYRNHVAKLVYHVNKLCVACGVAPLVDSSGGDFSNGLTFADISESTGTAVSGADVTSANAGIKKTGGDAVLVLLAGPVKEIATKLNALGSATGGILGAVAAA